MLQKSLKFGAENQIPIRLMRIEERFFSNPVTSDKKRFFQLIPNSQSKHSAQMLNTVHPIFIVKMDNYFGIGIGIKFMSARVQISAKFLIIVDFPIENDNFGSVCIKNRLLPAGQ